jgi:chemotaxis protein histidine kinase CheA
VRYLVELARNIVSGQGDSSDLIAAKRVVHTLKGSGAIIGLRGLASLGHHLEDILEHCEHNTGSQVAKPVADALLDAAYCLEHMVGYLQGTDDYPEQAQSVLQRVLDLANRIDRGEAVDEPLLRAGTLATTGYASPKELIETKAAAPNRGATERTAAAPMHTTALRISVDRVEELFRVAGEVSVYSAAMEARLKVVTAAAQALMAQNLRVQKRLFELETVVDVRALTMVRSRGHGDGGSDKARFDPLELDQYSELHSTAHALIEEAADARALAARLEEEIARTGSTHARQERLSKDLQHLVIGTRMTEVSTLTARLQRNVRSSCQATGKQAEVALEGGETLIDSDVLSRLADPLLPATLSLCHWVNPVQRPRGRQVPGAQVGRRQKSRAPDHPLHPACEPPSALRPPPMGRVPDPTGPPVRQRKTDRQGCAGSAR